MLSDKSVWAAFGKPKFKSRLKLVTLFKMILVWTNLFLLITIWQCWEPGKKLNELVSTFSGSTVGFCINEEEGCLLQTWFWKVTCQRFWLNPPVVIRAKVKKCEQMLPFGEGGPAYPDDTLREALQLRWRTGSPCCWTRLSGQWTLLLTENCLPCQKCCPNNGRVVSTPSCANKVRNSLVSGNQGYSAASQGQLACAQHVITISTHLPLSQPFC